MELSLEYQVREPKILLDKNPLLLLLHGYGSNDYDLFSFASELPDEYFVISARAPYDLQYGSYAWYAINFDADQNKFSERFIVLQRCSIFTSILGALATTLNGALGDNTNGNNGSATEITLVSTTGFPSSGTNFILVGTEEISYTGVTGNKLTGNNVGDTSQYKGTKFVGRNFYFKDSQYNTRYLRKLRNIFQR